MVGRILVILKLTLASWPPLLVWPTPSLSSLRCPSYRLYLEALRRNSLSWGKDMVPLRGTTHELKRLRMVLLSLAMATCQVFFFCIAAIQVLRYSLWFLCRAFTNKLVNFIFNAVVLYLIPKIYEFLNKDSIIKHTVKCPFCGKPTSSKVCGPVVHLEISNSAFWKYIRPKNVWCVPLGWMGEKAGKWACWLPNSVPLKYHFCSLMFYPRLCNFLFFHSITKRYCTNKCYVLDNFGYLKLCCLAVSQWQDVF